MKSVKIKNDVYWVGALDPNLRIFDIVMYTPFGTTYNSYVVKGSEKTAVFETVKEKFFDEYIERLKSLDVDITSIDYIVVDHTEPDHAGSVAKLLDISKNAKVVGSAAAIRFLKAIANRDFEYITVGDGDTLSLGNKTLKFISAPFLHWPDSIYTYIPEDNMLITCDSFGSHYCTETVFDDLIPNQNDYMNALKYYFDCIMGPFKSYVLKAVDKIKDLNIEIICTGHGPVLRKDPWKIIDLYKSWSTEALETGEEKNIVISYVSAYGYTEQLAQKIAEGIKASGNFKVDMFDVIHSDKDEILQKINKADGVLFGSPTINGAGLKPVLDLLNSLNPIEHGDKVGGAFGSYGWSGEAVPTMERRLKDLRMKVLSPGLKINFKPSEKELTSAFKYGESFAQKIKENINSNNKILKPSTLKKWKCIVCGLIIESAEVPEVCPACGAGKDQFIEVKEEAIKFKSEDNLKYVIVGNGAAGYYAADALRKRNKVCSIQVISEENHITYFRPELSDLISSEIPDDKFYISPQDWYKENNIQLTLNVHVDKIDTANKKLTLSDANEINYDKLILCNGSSNFIPPIKGSTLNGVFTLKNKKDAEAIKEFIPKCKNVAIIGGGLLGLEAAWEFKKSGLNVFVIEMSTRLLPKQLDVTGAEILMKAAETSEINIILGEQICEILGTDKVTGVKLKDGNVIDADMVLVSIGIRPNIDIAANSGIAVNRGILVNRKMETNQKDIYACGDAAELNGIVYGNWPAATDMGATAGANAAGDSMEFKDFTSSYTFNAMNVEIFACGELYTTSNDHEELEYKNSEKDIYRKLFFKDGLLVGGILINDTKKSVKLMNMAQGKRPLLEVIQEHLLN